MIRIGKNPRVRHASGAMLAGAVLAVLGGCASVPETGRPSIDHVRVLPEKVRPFSANASGGELPGGWQTWTLSRLKKPTEYRLVDVDGRTVVRASAKASASGLVHKLDLNPHQSPLLSWQWKVDELIKGADNTTRHREDSPVRIVVSFAGNIDSLPLAERMFFDNVRLFTRRQLPYATLMYIWENRVPRGTVLPNLHTSRIKMIVAESGRNRLGKWHEITRNVVDDYRRAFKEEPGRITSVAILTDTDNTGAHATALYGDIRFRHVPAHTILVSD
jgi:hypothetical protein